MSKEIAQTITVPLWATIVLVAVNVASVGLALSAIGVIP